ncbi:MAG: DUF3540 domain-containing protein [Desulfatirhabdiaceae bacterium]
MKLLSTVHSTRPKPDHVQSKLRVVDTGFHLNPEFEPSDSCLPRSSPKLMTGRIQEKKVGESQKPYWQIEISEKEEILVAERAAGCLLLPEKDDRVLVLSDETGSHYILSVLVKSGSASVMDFPGDLDLTAVNGRCALHSGEMEITGASSARISAPEMLLSGMSGRFRFGSLDMLARHLNARILEIQTAVSTLSMTAARFTARIGHILRRTGFELNRAKSVRTEVEDRFGVSAGQVSILAENEVTVDGEKIHLG